jgi:hypothetical protein
VGTLGDTERTGALVLDREATEAAGVTVAAPSEPVTAAPSWPRWLPATSYGRCLAALLAVYAVLYGWLLVATSGLPYVMDHNESFSSLWHASNMLQQDPRRSFWLTDEAYSPNPKAHPFIHTHQGNLPRLYAFVLYVLGARTIETQIVATTATAGVLAVWLLYHVLAKVGSPRFALVAGLVFLTDYLFFAQWQVVTYRVWHTVLLFVAPACVLGWRTCGTVVVGWC